MNGEESIVEPAVVVLYDERKVSKECVGVQLVGWVCSKVRERERERAK